MLPLKQVHLDFHTSELIKDIGKDFNAAEFAAVFKDAGVESVNIFAKCHHGMLYYNTKFPNKHPHLSFDLLSQQVDALHEVGIKAPIYLSVCWDEYASRNHIEWLERNESGAPTQGNDFTAMWKKLCLNTGYVDYLHAQIEEVMEKFEGRLDGIWLDIVAQCSCCCKSCTKEMLELGMDPQNSEDRAKHDNMVLKRFKENTTARIHKKLPGCPVFYNAGHIGPAIRDSLDFYSHLELESLPSGGWGYEHFPISVRFARNLGKDYIGMTGRFHKSWADFGGYKTPESLQYECFTTVAEGGSVCVGDQLHPSGKIDKATYELIGGVYKSISEKAEYLTDVHCNTEIAIFTPEALAGAQRDMSHAIKGAYRILSELQYLFDIIDDESDFSAYKLIVFPDVIHFTPERAQKVSQYLSKGGKILLTHYSGFNEQHNTFANPGLGLNYLSEAEYEVEYVLPVNDGRQGLMEAKYVLYEKGVYVSADNEYQCLGKLCTPYFNRTPYHFTSHFQTPPEKETEKGVLFVKQNVAYCTHPLFGMYAKHGMLAYKLLVKNALGCMLEKTITSDLPSTAKVILNTQHQQNRDILHILHYIPEKRCELIEVIQDVIPLYHKSFTILTDKKPVYVGLAPQKTELPFFYEKNKLSFTVEEITGHQMVEIKY